MKTVTLTTQMQTLKNEIASNLKVMEEMKTDLKFIKGDTVVAEKIQELIKTLPVSETNDGVLIKGNRENIFDICENIKADSITEITNTESIIANLKESNKEKSSMLKKLEKLQNQVDEAMGIIKAESATVVEAV